MVIQKTAKEFFLFQRVLAKKLRNTFIFKVFRVFWSY